ncbi:MAG: acylphosphatase [Nevskiales bacterium]
MTRCERFRVSGRVQGVGFRYAALHEARRLGVSGWVRNLPDGRVEVLAQGTDELLDRLSGWLQQGPPGARVTGVERSTEPSAELAPGFDIR